jgi:hypothetical protein
MWRQNIDQNSFVERNVVPVRRAARVIWPVAEGRLDNRTY